MELQLDNNMAAISAYLLVIEDNTTKEEFQEYGKTITNSEKIFKDYEYRMDKW
tara:strand:+ start:773 stop:931 length:159 start_codon:yes stop_codon:yes gene_type:complete